MFRVEGRCHNCTVLRHEQPMSFLSCMLLLQTAFVFTGGRSRELGTDPRSPSTEGRGFPLPTRQWTTQAAAGAGGMIPGARLRNGCPGSLLLPAAAGWAGPGPAAPTPLSAGAGDGWAAAAGPGGAQPAAPAGPVRRAAGAAAGATGLREKHLGQVRRWLRSPSPFSFSSFGSHRGSAPGGPLCRVRVPGAAPRGLPVRCPWESRRHRRKSGEGEWGTGSELVLAQGEAEASQDLRRVSTAIWKPSLPPGTAQSLSAPAAYNRFGDVLPVELWMLLSGVSSTRRDVYIKMD